MTKRIPADNDAARCEVERARTEMLERRLKEAQLRATQRAEFERQLAALRATLTAMRAAQHGRPRG
jgi:hypothetical protein